MPEHTIVFKNGRTLQIAAATVVDDDGYWYLYDNRAHIVASFSEDLIERIDGVATKFD